MLWASRAIRVGLPALLSAALAASWTNATDAASPASSRGAVELTVVDVASRAVVSWAEVRVTGGASLLADEQGRCFLGDLPAGPLRFRVSHVAYRASAELSVEVLADQTVREVVALEPLVHELERISVRAEPQRTPREATRGLESIATDQAAALPNPTGDLFQLVRLLPGVAAEDVGGEFHLRGGGSDETLVRIDGMEVRSLFHGRDFGGITGIVPLELVQRLDVYPGAFPAELGGRVSGAIDVALRDGGPAGFHGRVAADVTSARAAVEQHGARSSWFVAAREGYLHRILDSIQDEAVMQPAYRDLLMRSVFRPNATHEFAANYLRVEDHVLYEDGIDAHFVNAGYADHYLWGTFRWIASPTLSVNGSTHGAFAMQRRSVEVQGRDDRDAWRAGGSLEARLAKGAHVGKVGLQTEREWGDYAFRGRDVVRIGADGHIDEIEALDVAGTLAARRTSAWVQEEWALRRNVAVNVGLRGDHDTGTDRLTVSPRVAAAMTLPAHWLVKAAWGSHVQPPRVGLTGESELLVSSERSQSAVHGVVGVEKSLGRFRFGVDVWEKRFQPLDGVVSRTVDGVVERHVITDGRSRGIDASVRRAGRSSNSWFTYSLGRSDWTDGERVFSRDFDALHTLALANTYRVGRNWDFGVSYRFRTGTPYTAQNWRREAGAGSVWTLDEGQPNAARLPDYHRVDLRVTRHFRFDGWQMSVWGEALNLTNHDNVLWYAWRFRDPDGSVRDDPELVTRTGLPGIPSLGVEARF